MLKVAAGGASGSLNYAGTWNASTNTPTLTSSVGTKGDYYVVSVSGSTNLNGITDWQVSDWAVFNGSIWQKVDNSEAVVSVNGQTGVVVLTAANVGATPNTAYVNTSGLLSGGGQLTGNVTVSLTSVPAANVTGLGTMATQNANAVTITGGSVNSVTSNASTFTNASIQSGSVGNVTLSNITTTGLTGYLYGNGSGSNVSASTTIPVGSVSGAVPNTTTVTAGTGLAGGGALSSNITLNIANTTVTSGTYGGGTNAVSITVNAQGQLTAASNVAIPQGTVTNVATGTGLSGGPITSSGTINIANTAVTAGSYGNASTVGTFTVNGQGQLTAASNTSIAIAVAAVSGAVPNTVAVTAGTGLNGGGALTGSVTLNQTANSVQQLVGTQNNGTAIGTRQIINFLPGSGVTLTGADDSAGGRSNVTIAVTTPLPAPGTSGNILTSNGTSWNSNAAPVTGVTITDDTSTNATRYVTLTANTSGTITGENVSSSKLFFNPSTGLLSASALTATKSITGSLSAGAISYGTLGYTDTSILASFTSSTNSYNQILVQNTNNGSSASTDFVVSNDLGTASAYYGDFGMNSSTYSGTGSMNLPNAVYVQSQTVDLVLGTLSSNPIHFVVNNGATDAMTISATGNVTTVNTLTGAQVVASNGLFINKSSISANTTVDTGYNAMSTGPVTVASGISVTVASGQRWVVI
jgi:hypothetical protein